jgi:uncharacterized protein
MSNKDYVMNSVRYKKIGEQYCVTTDQGLWAQLSDEQLALMIKDQVLNDSDLYDYLVKKGIVLTTDSIPKLRNVYQKRLNLLRMSPSLHIIVMTKRCNFACVYCQVSASPPKNVPENDLDFERAKKIVDFILSSPSQRLVIEFQGGEALLNLTVLEQLIVYTNDQNKLLNKDIEFSIVSNFSTLSKKAIKLLLEHQVGLSTSLDGPAHVHDYNRPLHGEGGTYDMVSKQLDFFQDNGIRIGMLLVTTKYSLNYAKEIVDEYLKWDSPMIFLRPLSPLGYAKEKWSEIGYSMDEFLVFWDEAVDYIFELAERGINIHERMILLAVQKILMPFDPGYTDWRNPCGYTLGQVAYDINGDIYGCDEARNYDELKLGSVEDDNFSTLMTSEKTQEGIKASCNEHYMCDQCLYKPYCGLCPLLSYGESDSLVSNMSMNEQCQLKMHIFDFVFDALMNRPERKKVLLGWLRSQG